MGAVTILILAHFAVALAVLWPVIPPLLYGFSNFPHSRTQIVGARKSFRARENGKAISAPNLYRSDGLPLGP